jgi:cephalosporin hydroxylase
MPEWLASKRIGTHMKITIDTDRKSLVCENGRGCQELPLYSPGAFEILSRQWLKVGWDQKYSYGFSWLGRPVIQLPEDLIRVQEVIYRVQPDVLIETGVAHGGSLVFFASLFKLLDKGRVIGVDIEIRPENRQAIENHPLAHLITLIEGDSIATETVAYVKSLIKPGEKILVVLDSEHSYRHVLRELEAYSELVACGSYIVATDGVMGDLADVPHGQAKWTTDNPEAAARDFAVHHPEFLLENPPRMFNESRTKTDLTYWPGAWLRRV